jgi:hypothetical protein
VRRRRIEAGRRRHDAGKGRIASNRAFLDARTALLALRRRRPVTGRRGPREKRRRLAMRRRRLMVRRRRPTVRRPFPHLGECLLKARTGLPRRYPGPRVLRERFDRQGPQGRQDCMSPIIEDSPLAILAILALAVFSRQADSRLAGRA